jgi:predicted site-specific integrase-resolvase
MQPELYTFTDFLTAYPISRTTAYREVKAGRLRVTKIRRRSYVTRSDAEAWLKKCRDSGAA